MTKEQAQNIVKILIERKPDRISRFEAHYKIDNVMFAISSHYLFIVGEKGDSHIALELSEREQTQLQWKIEDWYKLYCEELEAKAFEIIENLPTTSQDDLLIDPITENE